MSARPDTTVIPTALTPEGPAGPRTIGIAGASFSGNKGSAAMLEALIRSLAGELDPASVFRVFSLYPGRDSRIAAPGRTEIVSAPVPVTMVLLPLAASAWRLLRSAPFAAFGPARYGPLKALLDCDILLDLSGISFSDGRGLPTLAYNVLLVLPALLCGIPVIKMSQAIGPFRSPLNRLAARLVLPRMRRIYCRGDESLAHASSLGLANCSEAADLAFLLPSGRDAGTAAQVRGRPLVGIAPSEVLSRICAAVRVDYPGAIAALVEELAEKGCDVLVMAHSNLGPGKRSRNNDYPLCMRLQEIVGTKAGFMLEDLPPLALRREISKCSVFVASRFHSMISALCSGTPAVVTSWGHKYLEVMRRVGLESFVLPPGEISASRLGGLVTRALETAGEVREAMEKGIPGIVASARSQIEEVKAVLAAQQFRAGAGRRAVRRAPAVFEGLRVNLHAGCTGEPHAHCASGGLVSALLARRISTGASRAAVCGRCRVDGGRLALETVVCRTPAEVYECAGSIYSDFDHLGGAVDVLRSGTGPFDLVLLPCQARALASAAAGHGDLREKIGLVACLWCGHATGRSLVDDLLRLWGAGPDRLAGFRYREGRWRGYSAIRLEDGTEVRKAFSRGYGLFQNLYADCAARCLTCTDHFGISADVSFGDAWLAEARTRSRKYSLALSMTERGRAAMEDLGRTGSVILYPADPALAVQAQMRALRWHREGSTARSKLAPLFGLRLPRIEGGWKAGISDYLAAVMVLASVRAFRSPLRGFLLRMPWWAHYPYLLAQKGLLSL
ncbi:hypothetical protein GX411_01535 [Candidatus Fermentibacteria bacterium]|nr:hypothetical protein [Candidatus Fermentibacteria bacterium]